MSMPNKSQTAVAPPPMDLSPYQGPWTIREASHLLRRTTFGPTQEMIAEAIALGKNDAIRRLFANAVPSAPPVRYTLDEAIPGNDLFPVLRDPDVPFGETWVNEPVIKEYNDDAFAGQILSSRTNSVYAWNMINMYKTELNLMPKLWMFWHNHFVVADFRLPHENYQYSSLLEQHAKGNFRQFVKDITINVSMLRYLNGAENSATAPNENYARELLELFTVGRGELAGPGDYTTFTEQDVSEISKILTGWRINLLVVRERLESIFSAVEHDRTTKTLSHRFGNRNISNAGDQEYSQLIDVIFESEAVSHFICRKLYTYFLNYEITPEIEAQVIAPMAQIFRDNDYEIEPALRALLGSNHFYSEQAIGCMIKNPLDYIISATKGLDFELTDDIASNHFFTLVYYIIASEQGMQPYFHPDVAGWKAYYQEPLYYRHWINSVFLPARNSIASALVGGGTAVINGSPARIPQIINVIDYAAQIPNASDPNRLIFGIADNLFTNQITEEQKDFLKELLLPGLPDFEWTVEYSEFLNAPNDREKRTAINNKLVSLISAMVEMPEFQLM